MAVRNNTLKTNPIIDAAKAKTKGNLQKLEGYVSRGSAGKIELYQSLTMDTCLEFFEEDIVHFVEAEKPTEPSLIFVHDEAQIIMRTAITATTAAALLSHDCSCHEDSSGSPNSMSRVIMGGGNPDNVGCDTLKTICNLKCGLNYPDDPLMRAGCNDSCAAAERLCKIGRGGSGGGHRRPA